MTKVKSYDKSFYPSIEDAVLEILDRHLISTMGQPIYDGCALDEICFFLAENNYQHQYVISPAPKGVDWDKVISIVWFEPNRTGNVVWYSKKTANKIRKVHMTLMVDENILSVDNLMEWLSDSSLIAGVDVLDWSEE